MDHHDALKKTADCGPRLRIRKDEMKQAEEYNHHER
jgi:hypothetical protein